jgi:hypothetical protein
MKARDLKVGITVAHEIKIGQDLTKRRIGVIVEVGSCGALVEFVDPRFPPTWLRSGQLSRVGTDHAAAEMVEVAACLIRSPTTPRLVFRQSEIAALSPPEPPPTPEPQEAPIVSHDKTKASPPDAIVPPDLSALEKAGLDPWAMYAALGRQLRERAKADALAAEAHVAKCDAAVVEAEELLAEYKRVAKLARDALLQKKSLAEKVQDK